MNSTSIPPLVIEDSWQKVWRGSVRPKLGGFHAGRADYKFRFSFVFSVMPARKAPFYNPKHGL